MRAASSSLSGENRLFLLSCSEVLVACKALLGSLFGLLEELLCNGGLRLLEGSVARLAEDERLVIARGILGIAVERCVSLASSGL